MDTISDRVAQYFASRRPAGVAAAYLFGSHARGAPHAESDVDVGVVLQPALLPDRAAQHRLTLELASDLISATHCNAVDVVVLNRAPPELSSTVVARGQRLYLADPEADHQFRRTAQLRYADLRPFLDRTRRTKLQAILG
jgi:predicted nucleotidyltransferase